VTSYFHCCHAVCSCQYSDCMVSKQVSSCHDTWRYRGSTIYRDISRPLQDWYQNVGTHDTYQGIKNIAQH